MSGFVMREEKQNPLLMKSGSSRNCTLTRTSSVAGENAALLELNTIARHYDGLIQIISVDGAMAQYASGSKWNAVMNVRYTEEEISRMLIAVSESGREQRAF